MRTDERIVERREADAEDGDLEYAERSFEAQRAAADAVTNSAEREARIEDARDERRVDDEREAFAIVDGKKVKAQIAGDRDSG